MGEVEQSRGRGGERKRELRKMNKEPSSEVDEEVKKIFEQNVS